MYDYILAFLTGISFYILSKVIYFNAFIANWSHERRDFNLLERTTLFVTIVVWCVELILFIGGLVNG